MDKLEKEIEADLKQGLEDMGCLVLKFVSPNQAGVPDRLVIVPGGEMFFVELKKGGEKPRPLQVSWHNKLKRMGVHVFVVDSLLGVQEVRAYVFDALGRKLPGWEHKDWRLLH